MPPRAAGPACRVRSSRLPPRRPGRGAWACSGVRGTSRQTSISKFSYLLSTRPDAPHTTGGNRINKQKFRRRELAAAGLYSRPPDRGWPGHSGCAESSRAGTVVDRPRLFQAPYDLFAARRSIVAQLGAGDAQFGAKSAQLGAIRPLQRGAHAGVDDDSGGKVGIGRRGSGMDDDALRGSFEHICHPIRLVTSG